MSKSRKKFIALVEKAIADGAQMAPEELMFSYKGILYPATVCSPAVFKALESFEARRDDVILAGYPKSGTNWVGQILTDLVLSSAKYSEDSDRLDDEEQEEFPYLEVGDAEKYQILLLVRNPKDVATSFYHFTNRLAPLPSYETWDGFFDAFMNGEMPWGSYFDYVFEWNKHIDDINVMAITYEELKKVSVMRCGGCPALWGEEFWERPFRKMLADGLPKWRSSQQPKDLYCTSNVILSLLRLV
ncbi:Sulfotransferase 6B1 [Varanus komodoensis]|nr:Sulfotransferase 6B1 [Varanus komodoensis]